MDTLKNVANRFEIIANALILKWKTSCYHNKVLILVEGSDDRSFYYKFFNDEISSIELSGGCKTLIEIDRLIQKNGTISNHLCIKDSDFDRLNSNLINASNFFYADAHDYEMMCFKNENVRKDLISNLAIPYEESLFDNIFSELSYISFFKWMNYSNHLNLNFRKYNVSNKTTADLKDFDSIYNIICEDAKNPALLCIGDLDNFITNHRVYDKFELTNGHDFLKRLCCNLKFKDVPSNVCAEDKIKLLMRSCFTLKEFEKTDLYLKISEWCNMNVQILNK